MFKNKNLWAVFITALVAGLIGGGIAFGAVNYFSNRQAENATAVPSGSNSSAQPRSATKVNVSGSLKKAYSSIKNAVVTVINLKKESSNSSNSLYGSILRIVFCSSSSSSSSKLETYAEGSGVIYKKSGNAAYVVTNNHVISGSNAVEIIMSNGKKVSAKVVVRIPSPI